MCRACYTRSWVSSAIINIHSSSSTLAQAINSENSMRIWLIGGPAIVLRMLTIGRVRVWAVWLSVCVCVCVCGLVDSWTWSYMLIRACVCVHALCMCYYDNSDLCGAGNNLMWTWNPSKCKPGTYPELSRYVRVLCECVCVCVCVCMCWSVIVRVPLSLSLSYNNTHPPHPTQPINQRGSARARLEMGVDGRGLLIHGAL
jgi:hypothetical protein